MTTNRRPLIEGKSSKGLEYIFGIKEMQSYPDNLNLDMVQPVIDLSMGGNALLHDSAKYKCESMSESIAGANNFSFPLISYNTPVGITTQVVYPINHHFVVWGISILVSFDAAGAAAFNTIDFASCIRLYQPAGQYVDKWFGEFVGATNVRLYFDGLQKSGSAMNEKITKNHINVCPAGCRMTIEIFTQAGANFPANTTFNVRTQGQAVPIGAPLPLCV
jgi:hypothetical protein